MSPMPDPEIMRKHARGDCIARAHTRISDIVPCGLDAQQRARLTDVLSQVWDDGCSHGESATEADVPDTPPG